MELASWTLCCPSRVINSLCLQGIYIVFIHYIVASLFLPIHRLYMHILSLVHLHFLFSLLPCTHYFIHCSTHSIITLTHYITSHTLYTHAVSEPRNAFTCTCIPTIFHGRVGNRHLYHTFTYAIHLTFRYHFTFHVTHTRTHTHFIYTHIFLCHHTHVHIFSSQYPIYIFFYTGIAFTIRSIN